MNRKALITSLTLAAAVGAISCTAATAAETPTPGEVEIVIAPSPEPTHEVPETPGNTDVPINPEPDPVRSERDETPADHQPIEDTVPVIKPEPEPSTPALEITETPGEVEIVIAPEDAQAHSRATSSDHAVTATDEVGIAPQAPGAKTPKSQKGSSTQSAADAKSPASVPSAQSTAPARDELAYTGSAETGGIAIGGFMLILTGAAGVWSVRRKTSS